jgi:membrane-bound lytic murein transglycosylase D
LPSPPTPTPASTSDATAPKEPLSTTSTGAITVAPAIVQTPASPLISAPSVSAPASIEKPLEKSPEPIATPFSTTTNIATPAPMSAPATTSIEPALINTGASSANPARVEPSTSAPLYATPAAVDIAPSDLWDRIRSGYAMTDLDDELVGKWEKYYADRPDYVARIVDRSGKYLFYIVTELERRNMPLEIALLPMIESAFNPIAHSSAKASGIWQFIPSTGTAFGMKQDWWADSRRDIVAATNGALDYLQKLHGMFGDWQLALASYNWGEGSVQRASAKSKAAGRDGTYLTLNMPAETRNYLPKLQAVKNIIRNPSAYGLTLASIPNEPYFKTITLAHALDLKKAAQLAGMTEAEFVALNPAHNRPVIAGRGEFQILLPADKADLFISRLESYDKPRVSWMAYKTRLGDRIEALAQRFGTTADALRSVNGIRGRISALPAGYHLLVPSDGPSEDALGSIQNAVFTKFPEYSQSSGSGRAHKVRKGETLGVIAKRYGVSSASLMKWNRLSKASVRAGQTIYVSGSAPVRAASGKTVRASYVKGAKVTKSSTDGKQVKAAKRGKAKKRR